MKIAKHLNIQPIKNYAIYFIIYSIIGFFIEYTFNELQPEEAIKPLKYQLINACLYGLIAIILIFLYQKNIKNWSLGFDILLTGITILLCQIIIIKILTTMNFDYTNLWNYENTIWAINETISIPRLLGFGVIATINLWLLQPKLETKLNSVNTYAN